MADSLSAGLLGWRSLQQLLAAPAAGKDASSSAGVFVSPLSLYVGLVLLRDGCGPANHTLEQVNALLGVPGGLGAAESQHDAAVAQLLEGLASPHLLLANAVWTNGVELLQVRGGGLHDQGPS